MLQPLDEHNQRLLANAHPPDWRNPEPRDRYHLVVVGGGTAGLVSAAAAASLGAKVALVERHLLGGDCLNGRMRSVEGDNPRCAGLARCPKR